MCCAGKSCGGRRGQLTEGLTDCWSGWRADSLTGRSEVSPSLLSHVSTVRLLQSIPCSHFTQSHTVSLHTQSKPDTVSPYNIKMFPVSLQYTSLSREVHVLHSRNLSLPVTRPISSPSAFPTWLAGKTGNNIQRITEKT